MKQLNSQGNKHFKRPGIGKNWAKCSPGLSITFLHIIVFLPKTRSEHGPHSIFVIIRKLSPLLCIISFEVVPEKKYMNSKNNKHYKLKYKLHNSMQIYEKS